MTQAYNCLDKLKVGLFNEATRGGDIELLVWIDFNGGQVSTWLINTWYHNTLSQITTSNYLSDMGQYSQNNGLFVSKGLY